MSDLSSTDSVEQPRPAAALAEIDGALARGDAAKAHQLANSMLRGGQPGSDVALEARIILRMGYCDLANSRVAQAYDGARRTAGIFREAASPTDEVDALALWSRAASVLGRSVEAVESALLATQLADDLPAGLWTARAHLSLGIAYAWGNSFAQAGRGFDTASQVVERYGDGAAQHEVGVERHWSQVLRRFNERQSQAVKPAPEDTRRPVDLRWAGGSFESKDTVTTGAAANLPVCCSCGLATPLRRGPRLCAASLWPNAGFLRPAGCWLPNHGCRPNWPLRRASLKSPQCTRVG